MALQIKGGQFITHIDNKMAFPLLNFQYFSTVSTVCIEFVKKKLKVLGNNLSKQTFDLAPESSVLFET